ncbi:MAG: transposase [Deltaproteobacteria bacterium]|nr:transposase [Deltaproteobacteria bacterium]
MARALPDAGRFAEDEIIIAVGVTIEGEKVVLGFVQSGTENERVIKDFLRQGDSGWRELLLYVTCFNLS